MNGKKIIVSSGNIELQIWRRPIEYHPTEKICPRKSCEHNGEVQPITQFTKSRNTYDGVSSWCKSCQADIRHKKLEEKKNEEKMFI